MAIQWRPGGGTLPTVDDRISRSAFTKETSISPSVLHPTGRWSTLGLSIGGDWRSNSLSTAVTTTDKTLNGNVAEQTTKSDQFSADAEHAFSLCICRFGPA